MFNPPPSDTGARVRPVNAMEAFFRLCAEQEREGRGIPGSLHGRYREHLKRGEAILNPRHKTAATIIEQAKGEEDPDGDLAWALNRCTSDYARRESKHWPNMTEDQLPELLATYLESPLFLEDPTDELYKRLQVGSSLPPLNDTTAGYRFSILLEHIVAKAERRSPDYPSLQAQVAERPEPMPELLRHIGTEVSPSSTEQRLAAENTRLCVLLKELGIDPDVTLVAAPSGDDETETVRSVASSLDARRYAAGRVLDAVIRHHAFKASEEDRPTSASSIEERRAFVEAHILPQDNPTGVAIRGFLEVYVEADKLEQVADSLAEEASLSFTYTSLDHTTRIASYAGALAAKAQIDTGLTTGEKAARAGGSLT